MKPFSNGFDDYFDKLILGIVYITKTEFYLHNRER